jgi:Tfp pilus assembly protein PilN
MMRRIELLPASYVQRRRQRRNVGLIVVAGMVVLVMVLGYWLVLGMQVADARTELAQAQSRNESLEADIASLQRFAELATEVQTKKALLAAVMTGDVDWPGVLTEIAMVLPGEVWLTNLTASAGTTAGAAPVGTETAPVHINEQETVGRIGFQGRSLSMPGVAKWLVRLQTAKGFSALWLNDATAGDSGTGTEVFDFDTTLELNDKALSGRFQEETP